MRVRCTLREIKEDLGMSIDDLERVLGIDARTVSKILQDDGGNWQLTRDKLYKFMLFAHEHGHKAFEIEPHPIWRTFEESVEEIAFFRGSNPMDAPVEDHLRQYFENLDATTRSSTESVGLEDAMKTRNCIIIGSPKLNSASEKAFALLWGANAFDSTERNRELIPVHFLGMTSDPRQKSAVLVYSTRHGLLIKIPGAQKRRFVPVDWLPPEKHEKSTADGQEAAVLVACNRPLGTTNDVTTVILAGYTGMSTLEIAREATYRRIPEMHPSLNPGIPQLAIVKFRFKKRAKRTKSKKGLRSPIPNSAHWAPPWEGFFVDEDI